MQLLKRYFMFQHLALKKERLAYLLIVEILAAQPMWIVLQQYYILYVLTIILIQYESYVDVKW